MPAADTTPWTHILARHVHGVDQLPGDQAPKPRPTLADSLAKEQRVLAIGAALAAHTQNCDDHMARFTAFLETLDGSVDVAALEAAAMHGPQAQAANPRHH